MEEISKNKQTVYLVVGIVLITLVIVGGTFAYLTNGVNIWNNVVAANTTCFTIDYNAGGNITGVLFPSSNPSGGLNGSMLFGINSSCSINGIGNIYLTVDVGSDILFQTVDSHCENSKTLKTMKDYTTQSTCEAQTNGKWVTDGTALKYALYDSTVTSSSIPISVGYINQTGQMVLYKDIAMSPGSKTYYVYVWLDGYLSDNTYQNQSFAGSISADAMQLDGFGNTASANTPVLDNGMVPVKISNDGTVTTVSSTDSSWYNYNNKEWANVVLVKSNGIKTRDYYKSNTGVTVSESDILAYYVWIPRYKYKIWTLAESSVGLEQTIDIVFESAETSVTQGSQVGDYITHPAFVWDGETVAGIWVGKFETGHSTLSSNTTSNNLGCTNENCSNADGLIIKPNVVSLRRNNISNQFYVSRSMTRSGNPFGMNGSTTDSHMMKNSEWGAVAYLSHSKYGINREIYINNSSDYITGRSGGNVSGSQNTLASQFPNNSTSANAYNSYGYYTWVGQEINVSGTIGNYASDRTLGTNASTTGNVTGVYDMSGGAYEYVMGYYSGANGNYASNSSSYFGWTNTENKAGFTSQIISKYWDNYLTTSILTACNRGVCLGHALSETYYWYSDYKYFVYANYPWLLRGGVYNKSVDGGVWYFSYNDGNAYGYNSFRSILIVE